MTYDCYGFIPEKKGWILLFSIIADNIQQAYNAYPHIKEYKSSKAVLFKLWRRGSIDVFSTEQKEIIEWFEKLKRK